MLKVIAHVAAIDRHASQVKRLMKKDTERTAVLWYILNVVYAPISKVS